MSLSEIKLFQNINVCRDDYVIFLSVRIFFIFLSIRMQQVHISSISKFYSCMNQKWLL